jgi:AcrR family transcriptional regulator
MNFSNFAEQVNARKQAHVLELFVENRQSFSIKKEKTIAKNLERIFAATLNISNEKGFHAMSMRDLGKETNLSTGALYNYFSSKEDLLKMMQAQQRAITRHFLSTHIEAAKTPVDKLRAAVTTHLYLSEIMQPWFYFSYMEAKNLYPEERKAAIQSELNTERMFTDILEQGCRQGVFECEDCQMASSLTKAMLQDWYLKRPKYARRKVSVSRYSRFVINFLEKNLLTGRDDGIS